MRLGIRLNKVINIVEVKMKYLSLKKYLFTSFVRFGLFLCFCLLGVCLGLLENLRWEMGLCIGAVLGGIFYLLPAVYYFYLCIAFKKKCENVEQKEGVITNWELGFWRYGGCVCLKEGEQELLSSEIFGRTEAKELVGRTVKYAVIDEILFIYEIKD